MYTKNVTKKPFSSIFYGGSKSGYSIGGVVQSSYSGVVDRGGSNVKLPLLYFTSNIKPFEKQEFSDAREFFGVSEAKKLYNVDKLSNYKTLALIKKNEIGYKNLGISTVAGIEDMLYKRDEISNRKLYKICDLSGGDCAKLTIIDPMFVMNGKQCQHTIALVLDKDENLYILDSFGNTDERIKEFHLKLKSVLGKKYKNIRFNTTPQQIDESLSCFNWAIANLERAKGNLDGACDLDDTEFDALLPQPEEFDEILRSQMEEVLESREMLKKFSFRS